MFVLCIHPFPLLILLVEQNAEKALAIADRAYVLANGEITKKVIIEGLKVSEAAAEKIKAAGGIADLKDAEDFINLGASRLGTSRIVKAVKAMEV